MWYVTLYLTAETLVGFDPYRVSGLQAAWLLKAVTCIDLTTLAGDDTPSNVHRLCLKAIQPVRHDLLRAVDMHDKGLLLYT